MELEKFKTTILPYREKMEKLARDILRNDVDAKDAVQETFLRLWNIRARLNNHPNVGGFVMRTIKNICIDKLREERNNLTLDDVNVAVYTLTPYVYTEQQDTVSLIRKIINTLPETQKRIMMMRDIDGYELDEIAEIMGTETTAVRVNLSRARKTVRDRFSSINKTKEQR